MKSRTTIIIILLLTYTGPACSQCTTCAQPQQRPAQVYYNQQIAVQPAQQNRPGYVNIQFEQPSQLSRNQQLYVWYGPNQPVQGQMNQALGVNQPQQQQGYVQTQQPQFQPNAQYTNQPYPNNGQSVMYNNINRDPSQFTGPQQVQVGPQGSNINTRPSGMAALPGILPSSSAPTTVFPYSTTTPTYNTVGPLQPHVQSFDPEPSYGTNQPSFNNQQNVVGQIPGSDTLTTPPQFTLTTTPSTIPSSLPYSSTTPVPVNEPNPSPYLAEGFVPTPQPSYQSTNQSGAIPVLSPSVPFNGIPIVPSSSINQNPGTANNNVPPSSMTFVYSESYSGPATVNQPNQAAPNYPSQANNNLSMVNQPPASSGNVVSNPASGSGYPPITVSIVPANVSPNSPQSSSGVNSGSGQVGTAYVQVSGGPVPRPVQSIPNGQNGQFADQQSGNVNTFPGNQPLSVTGTNLVQSGFAQQSSGGTVPLQYTSNNQQSPNGQLSQTGPTNSNPSPFIFVPANSTGSTTAFPYATESFYPSSTVPSTVPYSMSTVSPSTVPSTMSTTLYSTVPYNVPMSTTTYATVTSTTPSTVPSTMSTTTYPTIISTMGSSTLPSTTTPVFSTVSSSTISPSAYSSTASPSTASTSPNNVSFAFVPIVPVGAASVSTTTTPASPITTQSRQFDASSQPSISQVPQQQPIQQQSSTTAFPYSTQFNQGTAMPTISSSPYGQFQSTTPYGTTTQYPSTTPSTTTPYTTTPYPTTTTPYTTTFSPSSTPTTTMAPTTMYTSTPQFANQQDQQPYILGSTLAQAPSGTSTQAPPPSMTSSQSTQSQQVQPQIGYNPANGQYYPTTTSTLNTMPYTTTMPPSTVTNYGSQYPMTGAPVAGNNMQVSNVNPNQGYSLSTGAPPFLTNTQAPFVGSANPYSPGSTTVSPGTPGYTTVAPGSPTYSTVNGMPTSTVYPTTANSGFQSTTPYYNPTTTPAPYTVGGPNSQATFFDPNTNTMLTTGNGMNTQYGYYTTMEPGSQVMRDQQIFNGASSLTTLLGVLTLYFAF